MERDKEIENLSRVGDGVTSWPVKLTRPERRPIFISSSNHLVPTPPRETHFPLPPPTETHHTHRKGSTSNSFEVNVELPTTNVAIPILENVDVPILQNVDVPISENVDVPISQTQFQRIDLDSFNYDPGTRKQILEYHMQLIVYHAFVFYNSNGVVGQNTFIVGGFRNWKKVAKIIEKAPKNATYTSPRIQKEILHVYSVKVKKAIREEIGDAKFCIMVDEARDESMKEKMVVVFRYVDAEGFVKEPFFGPIHIVDIAALTLKKGIYSLLSQHCLDIQNIQGQRYDGASNIRGMWNGLQALILNDCPYAYYIHYFAHRLQLALVKASKQVVPINHFFLTLLFLIKIVNASCKRNEQLKVVNANEIAHLIDLEELETGNGLNQIGTLQRLVETRWSSHFRSISSLLKMFTSTVEILQNIIDDAINGEHWAEAESAYEGLTSFEFVFILHLEKETMEITDKLCQTLQSQFQDILNELNYRFNEDAMELLRLSSALEP
ncbi:uncharacterized protein LOC126712657 [Quercus robur]|uniref:uncharacterized protein LOC126712657 n=1 Tax=Quercus robur TaxID=38942 RepID=UPI002163AAAB|nr:uncharacterized protein LOC126712657 [Quercus robur]